MEYWVFWLLVIFLLSFIEVITVNLVTIWFVISAIIAMICSFFVETFAVTFSIFAIVGIILLLTTRKALKKIFDKEGEKTNADRVIGMIGKVTEDIKKDSIGEVKVDGKRWSAIANEDICKDSKVKILKIKGVKLVVEQVID